MYPYYDPKVFERVNFALIDLFDRIQVNRYAPNGTVKKVIRVPVTIHYSKNFADFILNTQSKPESKHTTPILGLRMGSPTRNVSGTTTSGYVRNTYDVETRRIITDRRPSPWTWTYTLTSYAENIYDHFQMVENIMTYFDPFFTVRIKEFAFSNIKRDIVVTLTSVSPKYNDELDREKARSYECEYTFEVKIDMYCPMFLAKLIKEVNMNIASSGMNISQIKNVQEDVSIEDYNRVMEEIANATGIIASEGKLVDTTVASMIKPNPSNEFRKFVDTNDEAVIDMVSLPAGAKIVEASVYVYETYKDIDSTVSVGIDSAHELVLAERDSNLLLYSRFSQDINVKLQSDSTIKIFYNRAKSTIGQFEVYIRWTI